MNSPNAGTRQALSQRISRTANKLVDDWISVPTWGAYCRGIGLNRPFVRKAIERSWYARR